MSQLNLNIQSSLNRNQVVEEEHVQDQNKPLPLNHVAPKDYSHWHYTSIRKYRADIPFWLDQALMKALAPKPELRYQAFSEFINDINKPNPYLESTANKSSIMKRDPVMVWKCISLCLFIALVCVLIIKT